MARLSGRVVDYTTDEPIPGVSVAVMSKTGSSVGATATNNEGVWVIDQPGADDLYNRVKFTKEGYNPQDLSPGSANNVDVVLMQSGTLPGVTITAKNFKSYIVAVAVILLIVILYFTAIKGAKL